MTKKEKQKDYQKNLGLTQKPEILDATKRIIRVKASDNDYDRDDDRIDTTQWKMPGYNPPLVDSHKTSESSDRRLGEIVNAFAKDGFYWNDIQLDTPQGDSAEWTAGEKLANRIWKMAKDGKDIRFSVGFIPSWEKMERNEKGGWDFKGQEQTELSVVLMPSNARAGNKEISKEGTTVAATLRVLLREAIKTKLNKEDGLYVCDIYIGEVVFNSYGNDSQGNWTDKFYKIGYVVIGAGVELAGDFTEVIPTQAYIDAKNIESGKTKASTAKKFEIEIEVANKDALTDFIQKEIVDKVEKAVADFTQLRSEMKGTEETKEINPNAESFENEEENEDEIEDDEIDATDDEIKAMIMDFLNKNKKGDAKK